MNMRDLVSNDEFGMDYNQLGENEQEWVKDYIEECLGV